jgi:hypothetical protein
VYFFLHVSRGLPASVLRAILVAYALLAKWISGKTNQRWSSQSANRQGFFVARFFRQTIAIGLEGSNCVLFKRHAPAIDMLRFIFSVFGNWGSL